MDNSVAKIEKSLDEIKKQIALLQQQSLLQKAQLDLIGKDVGTSDSKNLSEVLYKMDSYMSRDVQEVDTMTAEIRDVRQMMLEVSLAVKDIMKGLTAIYNCVDELEENLLPERKTV